MMKFITLAFAASLVLFLIPSANVFALGYEPPPVDYDALDAEISGYYQRQHQRDAASTAEAYGYNGNGSAGRYDDGLSPEERYTRNFDPSYKVPDGGKWQSANPKPTPHHYTAHPNFEASSGTQQLPTPTPSAPGLFYGPQGFVRTPSQTPSAGHVPNQTTVPSLAPSLVPSHQNVPVH